MKRSGGPHASRSLALIAMLGFTIHAAGEEQGQQLDAATRAAERFDLTDATIPAWRDHILPTHAERAWERIEWLPSFTAGLRRADEVNRPLLLWVMNGHPLGCT